MKIIKQFAGTVKEINKEERTITAYVSTGDADRVQEQIPPEEWKLDNYKNNPVILWAHDYRQPPVAKALWTKVDKVGLLQKIKFATTDFANDIFNLYQEGFLNAFSVGFDAKRDETNPKIFREAELLEVSCVPVPCNQNALAQRIYTGAFKSAEALAIMKSAIEKLPEPEFKSVIPYKDHGQEDEGAAWNGPKEIAAADFEDLKIMATWYDSENPEIKGSYKLPHHRAIGYKSVWRGVAAAMAALLGARGGVQLPAGDKAGVYSHLAKHYKEYGKEAPEMRAYSTEELKKFEEETPDQESDAELMLLIERNELLAEIGRLKEGRVLSKKNRELIKACTEALKALLDATDPDAENDGKSKVALDNAEKSVIIITKDRNEAPRESLAEIVSKAVLKADIAGTISKAINRAKGTV